MELSGLLHVVYDTQKVSDKYQKRDVVLKTDFDSQWPQFVSLQFSQDKCSALDNFRKDDFVTIQFNVKGREWNGPQGLKYFNTLDAWSISLVPNRTKDNNTAAAETNTPVETTTALVFNSNASDNDDLPF